MKVLCTAVAISTLLLSVVARADIQVIPVSFAQDSPAVSLAGTLKGRDIIDYLLPATAGQTMQVALKTDHPAAYFNVMPPGAEHEAIFIGSMSGSHWRGQLAVSGEYRVRLYLMRSAARRNEAAHYELTVGLWRPPRQRAELGQADKHDATVANTPYHATGQVACAIGPVTATWAQCEVGVVRGRPGNAEVYVFLPEGVTRVLTVLDDAVSSDGAEPLKAVKAADVWLINVGDRERYQIPAAFITGG